MKVLELESELKKKQNDWIMKLNQSVKALASVGNNNAMKTTPSTPTTQNALNTQSAPKPKTISKEEFKALYANPMFRY